MIDALFISYTGLLEPLGVSQVLPYVRGLAARGRRMAILSFEREAPDGDGARRLREALVAQGIEWRALRYHKRPPVLSTAADVAAGLLAARGFQRRGVRLLHARSHVPALIADTLSRTTGVPFLFDHRGRMADEYADAGVWPRDGVLYRSVERWERRFLRDAAHTVVLTRRMLGEIGDARARATVIPCAVDLARFRPRALGASEFDLVHAGSWSGLYLAQETLRFFAAYRRLVPAARLLVLVSRPSEVRDVVPGVEMRTARPDEVPALLASARAGLSLRRPGRAQVAASPVKVSEYLAVGLPVVSSPGVGDLDLLLPAARAGVVLRGFSDEDMHHAARELLALQADESATRERCRGLAERTYGLPAAVEAYDAAYRRALGEPIP